MPFQQMKQKLNGSIYKVHVTSSRHYHQSGIYMLTCSEK